MSQKCDVEGNQPASEATTPSDYADAESPPPPMLEDDGIIMSDMLKKEEPVWVLRADPSNNKNENNANDLADKAAEEKELSPEALRDCTTNGKANGHMSTSAMTKKSPKKNKLKNAQYTVVPSEQYEDFDGESQKVKKQKRRRRLCLLKCMFAFGCICAILGLALLPIFDFLLTMMVKKEMTLKEGSKTFENWKNPQAHLYFKFYFFNMTNADEVLKGAKPKLQELGPYVYSMKSPKRDIVRHPEDDSVSFVSPKYVQWEAELSDGLENDTFVNINLPYYVFMQKLSGLPFYAKWTASSALSGITMQLFHSRTVADFLWGYTDPLVTIAHNFIPEVMNEKWGLLEKFNGTMGDTVRVNAGEKQWDKFNHVLAVNNKTSLPWWESDQANMFNGTDSTLFAPFVDKEKPLPAFCADLCRSVNYVYEKPVDFNGLDLWRFTVGREAFAAADENPANEGFCSGGNCLDTGLLNISRCRENAPVVLSWPHFYLGSDRLLDQVEGLAPSKEKHQTFVDVQKTTGAVPRSARREQINVAINPVEGFDDITGVNETLKYLPVLWMEVSCILYDEICDMFRNIFQIGVSVFHIVVYVMIGVGFALITASVYLLLRRRRSYRKRQWYPPTEMKEIKS